MKRLFCLLTALLCAAFVFADAASFDVIGTVSEVPSGTTIMIDDFENGNYWIWAAFDMDMYGPAKISTSSRVSKKWASQGKQSLECRMAQATPENSQSAMYYVDYHWNFSGGKYLVMDFYNPMDFAYNILCVFQCTDNWNWDQTNAYYVEPGKHTLVWDISQFPAEDLAKVYRITISHGWGLTSAPGTFYVDNFRVIK